MGLLGDIGRGLFGGSKSSGAKNQFGAVAGLTGPVAQSLLTQAGFVNGKFDPTKAPRFTGLTPQAGNYSGMNFGSMPTQGAGVAPTVNPSNIQIPNDQALFGDMSRRYLESVRPGMAARGLLSSGVGQDVENQGLGELSNVFANQSFDRNLARSQDQRAGQESLFNQQMGAENQRFLEQQGIFGAQNMANQTQLSADNQRFSQMLQQAQFQFGLDNNQLEQLKSILATMMQQGSLAGGSTTQRGLTQGLADLGGGGGANGAKALLGG